MKDVFGWLVVLIMDSHPFVGGGYRNVGNSKSNQHWSDDSSNNGLHPLFLGVSCFWCVVWFD